MLLKEDNFNPRLANCEMQAMKPKDNSPKIRRFIFKSIHKLAVCFKLNRLGEWSYLKWLHTYKDEPFGFWKFAEDFLECEFSKEDMIVGE